jgi:hypothetical protein
MQRRDMTTIDTSLRSSAEAQEGRAMARGWQSIPGAPPCPRVVAGGRCFAMRGRDCLCAGHRDLLANYVQVWRDRRGRTLLTFEPEDVDGADLASFIEDMNKINVNVTISARSLWLPAATLLVIINKRDEPEVETT